MCAALLVGRMRCSPFSSTGCDEMANLCTITESLDKVLGSETAKYIMFSFVHGRSLSPRQRVCMTTTAFFCLFIQSNTSIPVVSLYDQGWFVDLSCVKTLNLPSNSGGANSFDTSRTSVGTQRSTLITGWIFSREFKLRAARQCCDKWIQRLVRASEVPLYLNDHRIAHKAAASAS